MVIKKILKVKSWKVAKKLVMRKLVFLILNQVTKYILEYILYHTVWEWYFIIGKILGWVIKQVSFEFLQKKQRSIEAINKSLKIRDINTKLLPFMCANKATGWVVLGNVINKLFADSDLKVHHLTHRVSCTTGWRWGAADKLKGIGERSWA